MQWACLAFSLDREKAVKQLALHTETSTLQEELVKKNHCKMNAVANTVCYGRHKIKTLSQKSLLGWLILCLENKMERSTRAFRDCFSRRLLL